MREVFAFLFEAYEMTKQQAAWRRRLQIPSDFSEGTIQGLLSQMTQRAPFNDAEDTVHVEWPCRV